MVKQLSWGRTKMNLKCLTIIYSSAKSALIRAVELLSALPAAAA
jgi:hypothetical protein